MAETSGITVTVENLDEVMSLLKRYPQISGPIVIETLIKSTIVAQRKIREEAPVDRNRLRNSVITTADGKYAYAVGTNVKYAGYVHDGTPPHRAPYAPIAAWAKRKGIPAFPVWYKIYKSGTKPNPFFQRGTTAAEPDINRYFKQCETEIASAMNRG